MDIQLDLSGESREYKDFVEKFKPKKTTDDCYTPDNVYDAIADWVANEYQIDRSAFVRPFFPGGDYERAEYPEGCTVVDNPPFSILSEIVKNYTRWGIKFFLFAPTLTLFSAFGKTSGVCGIACGATISYDNGAKVNTSFLTNLENGNIARSAPGLYKAIKNEDDKNSCRKAELPKYIYNENVLTAAMVGRLSQHGVEFSVKEKEAFYTRALDAQKPYKKEIFGSGFLLSESAAKRKAEAEAEAEVEATFWKLSDRERAIVETLN